MSTLQFTPIGQMQSQIIIIVNSMVIVNSIAIVSISSASPIYHCQHDDNFYHHPLGGVGGGGYYEMLWRARSGFTTLSTLSSPSQNEGDTTGYMIKMMLYYVPRCNGISDMRRAAQSNTLFNLPSSLPSFCSGISASLLCLPLDSNTELQSLHTVIHFSKK